VATTDRPLAMVGEFACMEVRDINERAGAFLGWGLPKDLLLPFREQGKSVKIGQKVVVAVIIDGRTDRIIASAKVDEHVRPGVPAYRPGQEVDVLAFARTPLGYGVVVENAHRGPTVRRSGCGMGSACVRSCARFATTARSTLASTRPDTRAWHRWGSG
jgi:predicted RNA-binding protein (virulence factor B family)